MIVMTTAAMVMIIITIRIITRALRAQTLFSLLRYAQTCEEIDTGYTSLKLMTSEIVPGNYKY